MNPDDDAAKSDDPKNLLFKEESTHVDEKGQFKSFTVEVSGHEIIFDALSDAGVPDRFIDARFETFEARPGTAEAIAVCRQLAEIGRTDYRSAILTGPPGTGKTHLAAAILRARAESWYADKVDGGQAYSPESAAYLQDARRRMLQWGFKSRFANVPRLLQAMRRTIRDDDAEDPLDPLTKGPILVLDDLGAEKVSDWTLDRLHVLIGSRYDDEKGTIVTSNWTLDQLADRGFERIISRLCEDGPHVRIEAPDYRLRTR